MSPDRLHLCTALRLGGESFSEQALRAYPRQNASEYGRFPATYIPELAARLVDAERHTIERFYAHDPIPAALVAGAPSRASRTIHYARALRTARHRIRQK